MLWIIIIHILFIYFLFTESRILRFTIRFYNLIRETLLTIQGRIPILITWEVIEWDLSTPFKHQNPKIRNNRRKRDNDWYITRGKIMGPENLKCTIIQQEKIPNYIILYFTIFGGLSVIDWMFGLMVGKKSLQFDYYFILLFFF